MRNAVAGGFPERKPAGRELVHAPVDNGTARSCSNIAARRVVAWLAGLLRFRHTAAGQHTQGSDLNQDENASNQQELHQTTSSAISSVGSDQTSGIDTLV